jgi:hypothetical protein
MDNWQFGTEFSDAALANLASELWDRTRRQWDIRVKRDSRSSTNKIPFYIGHRVVKGHVHQANPLGLGMIRLWHWQSEQIASLRWMISLTFSESVWTVSLPCDCQ